MADDMTIDLRINPAELAKTLRNLQNAGRAVGLTVQHLVWEVAADAAKDCVKYTPPRTESVGSFGAQRKLGEGAIGIDIERLFADRSNPDYVFFQNNGRRYGRRANGRAVFEIPNDHWDIKPADVESVHLKHRTPKGRIKRQPHQYWSRMAGVKRYLRTLKKRVGELKAGWMPGVEMFCRLARKKAGIPQWITRQAPEGRSLDRMTADGNGYIQIDNVAHHRQAIRPDMIRFIQAKRQKDVERYLPKRLEKIALRHNAGGATPEAVTA